MLKRTPLNLLAGLALVLLTQVVAIAQPVWENANNIPATGVSGMTPLLRREAGSIGMVVNLNERSTVYYVIYAQADDPGIGAITAAAIKAGTTTGTKHSTGSFVFGDGSYCRNVYPNNTPAQCAAVDGNVTSDRVVSINTPIVNVTYVAYFTAESIATPGTLTAVASHSVLVNNVNRSCFRVGSSTLGPIPVFAPNLSNNCSPASFNLTVGYVGVDFRSTAPVLANVNFGDASATGTDQTLALQNSPLLTAEQNKAFRLYQTDLSKIYNYSAGANPGSNPTGSGCTFLVEVEFNAGPTDCGAVGGVDQSTTVTIWDVPNTARGLQDVEPNGLNSDDGGINDEEVEVCEGGRASTTLIDNSVFNCTTVETARAGSGLPNSPNREARWVQFVYGAAGTMVATSGALNDQVTIGGVNFTAAQLPIYGPVVYIPATSSPTSPNNPLTQALPVIMPINAQPGDVLMVEMRSWNTCLPYDNDVSDGGLNPTGGSFDLDLAANNNNKWITQTGALGTWPGNHLTFPNANTTPVTFQKPIVIVDSPSPPVVPNVDICSGDPRTIQVTPTLGAGFRYRLWTNATATTEQTGVGSPSTAGTFTSVPVNDGQRVHYWVTVESTGTDACRSQPTEVTITRRPGLATPNAVSGPPNLCPGTTGYTYSTTTTPDLVDFDDTSIAGAVNFQLATEMEWTVPAAVGNITAGTGTNSITVTSNAAVGGGSVSVRRRYVTNSAPVNPPTAVSQCRSNAASLTVNVRGRPTAAISPDPLNVCEGSGGALNGNPSLPATVVGIFTPAISAHTWSGSTVILDATNVQQPNLLTTAPPGLGYGLTYVVVADFGSSVSCSSTPVNSIVNISASPTPAAVGANQDKCFVAGPLISDPLGGSNPGVGSGVWTKFSGTGVVTFLPSAGTPNATATVPANGVYVFRWTVTNGTCVSSADITVDYGTDPGPQDAGDDFSRCGLTGHSLPGPNSTAPTLGTVTWSQISGPGTTTFGTPNAFNTTIVPTVLGTYRYQLSVVSGTCAAQTDLIDVTFNNSATSTPGSGFTTCVDPGVLAAINLSGAYGGGATGGRWERVIGTGLMGNGTAVGATDATNPVTDTYTPTLADITAGTVQMRLVASGATTPCPEVGSTITITLDRRPTGVDAGPAQPLVCANPTTNLGDLVPLAATALAAGETGTWTGPAGVTFSNLNSPTSTASNLPLGLTTLTWTVRSPLFGSAGSCATVPDQVDITVNALPAANDPLPTNQCEIVEGSGVALGVDLTQYENGITGGVGNRTVEWYDQLPRNAGNLIATPTSFDVSNATPILYTRVYNTITNCFRDGQVTFTINPLPLANDLTGVNAVRFCEDFPAGSDQVLNTNLNAASIITAITGGAGNRTIFWFNTLADANANANAIATPNSYDILNDDETVFARVTNTLTTCVNVARVDLVVKDRPTDPTIGNGSANQCLNGFDLFTVTPVAGATYIWDIDDNAGEFDVIAGGAPTDFLVVVSFPNVFVGDIRVTIDLNGCQSNEVSKTITVQATPDPVVITASKDPVCENDGGIVYTATSLPATDYTWDIPVVGGATGSSIIGGQGTNVVTVNIGTTSGDIRVTPQTVGGSCAGTEDRFFIDVRERPELDTYPITPVCSDDPIGIVLQEATGSPIPDSYRITNVTVSPGLNPSSRALATGDENLIANDSYTNIGNGNTQLDVRYTIVPISAEGCEGSPKDIIVRIRPEPVVNPNLDRTVCSRETANIVLQVASNSAPADRFEITTIENLGGLVPGPGNAVVGTNYLANEIAADVWTNTTGVTATIRYFIRPVNTTTGCIGDPPYPILLIVNPEPVITPPLIPNVICSSNTPTITLVSSIGGTFDWSVKSMTGIITGGTSGSGNTITNVLVNNELVPRDIVYEVIATGPGGALGSCPSQPVDFTITVNPSPTTNNVDLIVCSDASGGNTFVEDLSGLEGSIGGVGPTFSWYQDLGKTLPITGALLNAYPLQNGIPVYVDVFNGQCRILQPVTYTVNPRPLVSASITSSFAGGNHVSCFGASNGQVTSDPATMGSPNYLYSVDGASFFTSRVFNGLAATGNPYRITVRDSKGCESQSGPMTLIEPDQLTATTAISSNFNGRDISCPGEDDGEITTTPVDGVGPYTFKILELPGNTTGNGPSLLGVYTDLRQGTYTVVVRDANNCTVTTNTVSPADPPIIVATATVDNPVTCNGDNDGQISVVATGGTLTGPLVYTYSLNTSPTPTVNTTGVFSGLAPLPYIVTVSDNNGCSKPSNTITITQPSVLAAFASVTSNYAGGSQITCPGEDDGSIKVIANGGNGGYIFDLVADSNPTGDGTGIYTGLIQGSYTVLVTDAKGCDITTTAVTLSDPLPINPSSFISNALICNGATNGQITITANGGSGLLSFARISGSGSPVTNGTGVFPGLSQGTYDFVVSDANACNAPIQVILNQPGPIIANAGVISDYNTADISCPTSSDGVIQVIASGGSGMFTYIFDNPPTPNSTGNLSGIYSGIVAGTGYTFTVRDANAPGCLIVTSPTAVNPPAALGITSAAVTSSYFGQDMSCTNANDAVITIIPNGGTTITPAGYTYVLNQDPLNTSGAALGVFTGVSPGSYTVTVRDANNCLLVTTPVVVDPYPVINASGSVRVPHLGGRQISCNGAADGEIEVTPNGGVGPYTYTISGPTVNNTGDASGPSTIYTNLTAGVYTVTVFDQNSCLKTTSTLTIAQPDLLQATAQVTSNYNGQQVKCFGSSDGIIKATVTGGTTAYAYVLNGMAGNFTGTTSGTFTGVPAGAAYTISVTDINSCNTVTLPVPIAEPAALVVSGSVTSDYHNEDISCNGANDAVITVLHTAGTGTGSPTYSFDAYPIPAGNTSGLFSGIFTGVHPDTPGYMITATDVNGCTDQIGPIQVTEPIVLGGTLQASNFNGKGFNISCFNLQDGEITVTPTGGTGNPVAEYRYLLLEASSNLSGEIDQVFNGLRAGSYRARITDNNGCTFITPAIDVTQPPDISIEIEITSNYGATGSDISCATLTDGQISVKATISGGTGIVGTLAGSGLNDFTYVLSDNTINDPLGDGVFNGLNNQLYTVTATDFNGCSKESLPVVLNDPLPLFEGVVGLDKSVCEGKDPAAFTELANAFGGTGNYLYQWQQSADNVIFSDVIGAQSATFDPPVVPDTTFFRRIIRSGTCPALESNTVKVNVLPLPLATIPALSPICEGFPMILTVNFSPGQAPFYYNYTATDVNGTTTFLNQLAAAAAPIIRPSFTETSTFEITEIHDFYGCEATSLPAPVTVPVIKVNPAFSIVSSSAQCSGGEFEFQFTVDPDVDYLWIWGDGQTEPVLANSLSSGSHTIPHTYRSFNTSGTTNFPVVLTAIASGCPAKQTNQTVQVYPNILINLFPDKTEICGGDEVRFNNPTAGGTTHHWFYREQGVVEERDERTFIAASDQTFTFNNTTIQNPIVYELVYEVNNANCAADTVIEITVYREVAANFTRPAVLPLFVGGNANMTFTNTSVPIDGTEFSYEWDFGNGALQVPVNAVGPFNFNYITPGTKTVRLLATNLVAAANGLTCTSVHQETFNLVLPPLVAGFEYTPQATCFPASIQITRNLATGNTFEWRLVDGTGRQLLVTNDTLPTFTISSAGRYTIFQSTKNTLTGQTASADNAAVGNNIPSFSIPIDIYPQPFAAFEARPTVVYVPDTQLQVFNLSSSPVDPITATSYPIEYKWYFGDGSDTLSTADSPENFEPTHFYTNEGAYDIALLAINDHGNGAVCIDTAIQRISAKAAGFTRVPNAFTPSENGPTGGVGAGGNSVNDVFLPIAKGVVDFQMQIFDRWGNLIFETKDKTIGWDGYDKNGHLLPAGVYVYKLVMRLSNNQRTTQIGDVTLIR